MKPAYAWSCLACGARNAAQTSHCAECGCTAMTTVAEANAFRAQHIGRGGVVLPGAAIEATPVDPELSKALWSTLAAVLGVSLWT